MAQIAATGTGPVYPAKPLRLLFGYTAGGAGDVSARLLAHKLSEHLGQNVVVENRPGAGGAIADEAVARSPAEGYTLLYAAGSTTILPALRAKLPYDVEHDFAPVSLVVITSFVLTLHPSVPVHDVKGLIALARAQPGKLAFSSPGIGSSVHFAAELFKMMADINMLHVPFRGGRRKRRRRWCRVNSISAFPASPARCPSSQPDGSGRLRSAARSARHSCLHCRRSTKPG